MSREERGRNGVNATLTRSILKKKERKKNKRKKALNGEVLLYHGPLGGAVKGCAN